MSAASYPTEPPLACYECGRVIGPRAARTVTGHATTGDELLACFECGRKLEEMPAPKMKARRTPNAKQRDFGDLLRAKRERRLARAAS